MVPLDSHEPTDMRDVSWYGTEFVFARFTFEEVAFAP